MTADQVRKFDLAPTGGSDEFYQGMLREAVAQLAELNEHIGRLEFLAENVINLNHGGVQVKVNEQ